MKFKLAIFFFVNMLIKIGDLYSQMLITDTIAKKYYITYQVDENSNVKNGTYEMIYKDKIITKGNYKNNNRIGLWEFRGMNDTLDQKGAYVDGYKDGIWESYYSDGKLSCTMVYKNGKKNGTFKGLFRNGNTSFETNYINDSVQGVSIDYYENGKVSDTETYLGDTLNGITKRYYENGTLKEQKYKIGSKRDSVYLFYYEDGSLWEHIIYKNGNPYNVIAYNAPDGKPIDCCTLKDGNGIMHFYDKEGRVTDEITYKNSEKNGYAKYSEKGIVTGEGNYLNGMKDSVWIDNYESGELYSKIKYVKDQQEGEALYYYKSGSVSQKGQFLKGDKSGSWTSYDDIENVESELNYNANMLDGAAKYFDKGKLVCEGKHNKGHRIFVWTFYNPKGKVSYVYDYGYTFVPKDEYKRSFDDTPVKNAEIAYSIADDMPSFPGGEKMMMEFIQKNIVYPNSAKEENMSGTVYVNFVVDNTGEIINVKIIRGVLKSLDAEAKRIVEVMPRWTPGMQNGRPVSVSFNLPIKYKLR